jgi:hypothetical protein
MRIFSAIFDTVLLPVKVAEDVFTFIPRTASYPGCKSRTREQIEKIERELGL